MVDVKALDDLPEDKVVLVCTGSQGEPMSALSRIANRDHCDPHRRGRHRHPRVVAHPRQRERRLPRHQRAVPLGRQRRAQGERHGARLRPRVGRRAALRLQHRPAAATSCRCTASGGTCAPTPTWRSRPACRATAPCSPRTAWSSTSSTGARAIVGAVPCGYVYVDGSTRRRRDRGVAQGPADPARRGLHLGRRRRRLGHRQGGRRPGDPRPWLRRGRQRLRRRPRRSIEEALDKAAAEGIGDSRQLEQMVRRTVGKWVSDTYRRRPMIIPLVVEV